MADIFENESEVLQDSGYRAHLNRNWQNGNDEFRAINERLSKIGSGVNDSNAEVVAARVDSNGKRYNSLSERLDSNQTISENAKSTAEMINNKMDTVVENKIAQMDNGVHAYSNADAIKQAYPNGKAGIFVAVDTGHQWYWVNGAWADAGSYQSTGISDEVLNKLNATYKFSEIVIDSSNYQDLLPSVDDVKESIVYLLKFDQGEKQIPQSLPFKKFPYGDVTLINSGYHGTQTIITSNGLYNRSYDENNHTYKQWYDISGMIMANENITDLSEYKKMGDLPVGKLFTILAGVFPDMPTETDTISVLTLGSRAYSRDGINQLAYDKSNNCYVRSLNSNGVWNDWFKITSDFVINAFRENIFYDYETRNVVWQRRNNLNVVMDKWLDNQNKVQPYSGWCYTDYFIPVRPNHDYSFIAKDSGNIEYNVVGVDSVYINLYDDKLNYINQIYTRHDGIFNTQNAYYIKLSMSYKTYMDRQYLSLILGKDKPAELNAIENANYSDSALYANGSASYDLVPNTTVYKLDSLPLRLYTDSMTRWSIDKPEIYLYDNRKNEVVYDSVTGSYLLPAKPRTALSAFDNTFHAIKGRATNSYWKFDAKTLDKYTIIRQRDIPTSFGDGQNLNVMFMGDSLTNAGVYVDRVGELASADEHTTINLLGTRGETYKHEGRGGWSAKIYCTESIFNTYNNPFLNLNGKFDFGYYAAKNSITKLDILFLNLGTNDVTYNDIESDPNFDEDLTRYKEILSSIKSTFPDVKIVLGSTITPARYKGANLYVKTRRQEWNDRILSLCLGEGYTYAPYSLIIDPVNDFKYKEEALDDYNATTVKRVADNTHPADSGYKKMGDLSYSIIKKLAENIKTGN